MSKTKSEKMIYHEILDTTGSKKPWIIMVHGFTHTHQYFSAQVPAFRRDFRILLVDLRGHGRSANISGPYGVEEYADDIQKVLDDVGIEKAHYWGTHTGAAIGLVMALRYPERFVSLILEGTFLPGFPMPRVGELIDRARAIAQSKGLREAREDWFNHADWFAYIREHADECRSKEHQDMVNEFTGKPWLSDLTPKQVIPVAEYLSQIQQPALVYNGREDLEDFKQAAAKIKASMPNVQCEVIQNAGGFPAWENPAAVNLLVRSFLTQFSS